MRSSGTIPISRVFVQRVLKEENETNDLLSVLLWYYESGFFFQTRERETAKGVYIERDVDLGHVEPTCFRSNSASSRLRRNDHFWSVEATSSVIFIGIVSTYIYKVEESQTW